MNKLREIINEKLKNEKEIETLNKIQVYETLKKESFKIIENDSVLRDFCDKIKIYIEQNVEPTFLTVIEKNLEYKHRYFINDKKLNSYFDNLFQVSGTSWWNYYVCFFEPSYTFFKLNVDKPFETSTHFILYYIIILLLESVKFELKDIKHFNCVVRKQYKKLWSWKCEYILYFCFYYNERVINYDYYFPSSKDSP